MITLLGTIASGGPTLGVDPEGDPEARFTLLVSGLSITVVAVAQHAVWIVSTVNSGVVAQVQGVWQSAGPGRILQAWCVDPVPHAAE